MTMAVVSQSERHHTILLKTDFYNFYLANVYAPNILTKRVLYFDELCDKLEGEQNNIVCGDFNTVADLVLDKHSQVTTNSSKAPTTSLQQFMTQTNLIDVYRARGVTWQREKI